MIKKIAIILFCLSFTFLAQASQTKKSLEQAITNALVSEVNPVTTIRSALEITDEMLNPDAIVTMTFEQVKHLLTKELPPASLSAILSMFEQCTADDDEL